MRTEEQGLLTPGDITLVVQTGDELRQRAHGGELKASAACPACAVMEAALAKWLGEHTVGPEELEELERAADLPPKEPV